MEFQFHLLIGVSFLRILPFFHHQKINSVAGEAKEFHVTGDTTFFSNPPGGFGEEMPKKINGVAGNNSHPESEFSAGIWKQTKVSYPIHVTVHLVINHFQAFQAVQCGAIQKRNRLSFFCHGIFALFIFMSLMHVVGKATKQNSCHRHCE